MRTAIATGATLITAVITNYATQFGPDWTRNPRVVWSALFISAVLTIGGAVGARGDTPRKRRRLRRSRMESLRPPVLESPLRGREAELNRLKEMVGHPASHIAVICGAGGVGKTALAAAIAHECKIRKTWWIQFRDSQ